MRNYFRDRCTSGSVVLRFWEEVGGGRRQRVSGCKWLEFINIKSRILPPLRHAPLFDFEVPRCRIIVEILAEILFVAVPKMKVSYLLDILVGGVCNIDQLPVGEVFKKVPIGLTPLICFVSCLGWHRAEMERGERSCGCVVYVCSG